MYEIILAEKLVRATGGNWSGVNLQIFPLSSLSTNLCFCVESWIFYNFSSFPLSAFCHGLMFFLNSTQPNHLCPLFFGCPAYYNEISSLFFSPWLQDIISITASCMASFLHLVSNWQLLFEVYQSSLHLSFCVVIMLLLHILVLSGSLFMCLRRHYYHEKVFSYCDWERDVLLPSVFNMYTWASKWDKMTAIVEAVQVYLTMVKSHF